MSEAQAKDARGRALPEALLPATDGLRIEVADTGAVLPIDIDPVCTPAPWTVEGDTADQRPGHRVAFVGEIAGDGYDDLGATSKRASGRTWILGAHHLVHGASVGPSTTPIALARPSPTSTLGVVYIHHGSATGVGSSPGPTTRSPEVGSRFGGSIAGFGDANGDGHADLLVGAYDARGASRSSGTGGTFVYHGSASGRASSPSTTLMGSAPWGYSGWSVAGLGDVHGDGHHHITVGAPEVAGGEGRATVHHGSASAIATTAARPPSGGERCEFVGWVVRGPATGTATGTAIRRRGRLADRGPGPPPRGSER